MTNSSVSFSVTFEMIFFFFMRSDVLRSSAKVRSSQTFSKLAQLCLSSQAKFYDFARSTYL